MNRVEKSIQAATIIFVKTEHPTIIITATANELSYKETRQIGSLGIPDLLLFSPWGMVLFLELKATDGKLSPSQIDWNIYFDSGWSAPNYSRDVAYGFPHAREIINKWVDR